MTARMAIPVIKLLLAAGHIVTVIAEGKAVGVCKENGIPLLAEGTDELKPMGEEAWQFLDKLKPDIVCVGCSCPINWEREIAYSAQKMGIPVAAFSDVWGALSRLELVVPDIAFVIDDVAARLESGRAKRFVTVGDIASLTAQNATANILHAERMRVFRDAGIHTVLVVGDSNEMVEDICRIAAESIRASDNPKRYLVIPRLVHPKFANDPNVSAIVGRCLRSFSGIVVDHFTEPDRASTDWLATQATITVATFSTPLRTALHAGRIAASVYTKLCLDSMEAETKNRGFPLVQAGVIDSLKENPIRMDSIIGKARRKRQEDWARSAQFHPERALEAIEALK